MTKKGMEAWVLLASAVHWTNTERYDLSMTEKGTEASIVHRVVHPIAIDRMNHKTIRSINDREWKLQKREGKKNGVRLGSEQWLRLNHKDGSGGMSLASDCLWRNNPQRIRSINERLRNEGKSCVPDCNWSNESLNDPFDQWQRRAITQKRREQRMG